MKGKMYYYFETSVVSNNDFADDVIARG